MSTVSVTWLLDDKTIENVKGRKRINISKDKVSARTLTSTLKFAPVYGRDSGIQLVVVTVTIVHNFTCTLYPHLPTVDMSVIPFS